MPIKNNILASLAVLGLVGGGAALAIPHAQAASMKCGQTCVTLASQKYTAKNVVSAAAGGAATLAPFWFSGSEDLAARPIGTVRALAAAHLIAPSVSKTYGTDLVYEYESVPKGQGTVRCLGVSATHVTLQQCGVSAATLWIAAAGRQSGNYMPLINAAASVASALVLTASSAGGPLSITQMSLSSTGVCAPNQMWELVRGVFGNATEEPVTTVS